MAQLSDSEVLTSNCCKLLDEVAERGLGRAPAVAGPDEIRERRLFAMGFLRCVWEQWQKDRGLLPGAGR